MAGDRKMPKVEVLKQIDGPVAGYVTVLTRVHIAAGEQVSRHTHPGVESTYVLEGEGIVSRQGYPDRPLKVGDAFQVPSNLPHSVQIGPNGALAIANYVVEKDKPLVNWL